MTQPPPPGNTPRRPAATISPSDLDALLESLQSEPRPASAGAQPPSAERGGDLTARRVQALIRAFDVLQKQVGAIASQGETISKVAENQARDAKAIGDLQRNMRYLRAIVIQQLQGGGAQQVPPLQIKLLVGHLVEQYQQAERDAALLTNWAMLFVGLALGLGGASAYVAVAQNGVVLSIFVAVAALALLVAIIFWSLARSARQRAVAARRAMDESTVQRRIAAEASSDQP
jgi:hypothetical protein